MNTPLFFNNAGDDRGTPQAFFDTLNAEFHFDLDAAADSRNHKCEMWMGEGGLEMDAIEADWGGEGITAFLNPPYSVAGAFVAKAREEADKGARVVLLLPVRSDTRWWHQYIYDKGTGREGTWRPGVKVRFISGRLNFELHVPENVREWIKSEYAAAVTSVIGVVDRERAHTNWFPSIVTASGLPRMAISRILEDFPDEELLEGAPFPSCVVIFEKAGR